MNNRNPLYENFRTDFLLKHPTARKMYGGALKFMNSKYAFPVSMHSYGWGTIMLPSGSVYAIALGSLPQDLRKTILKRLRHCKDSKDALNVLKELSSQGIKIIKDTKNTIASSFEKAPMPTGILPLN